MSRILAVFGATGQQGGSVVDVIRNDAVLSKQYNIRAITRDPGSEKSQALASLQGVEVVQGDTNDKASIAAALRGCHVVYSMTNAVQGRNGIEAEFQAGKVIADVAVEVGVEFIIFSTLPSAAAISHGKYTTLNNMEGKFRVEQYMKGLPIKSCFMALGFFMENFRNIPFFAPQKRGDAWILEGIFPPNSTLPLIATRADTGKWVAGILTDLPSFEGKNLYCATADYSLNMIAAAMSTATGQSITCKHLTKEEFESSLPEQVKFLAHDLGFLAEFGCWGPDVEEQAAWSRKCVRGNLTTFEEYLQQNKLQLG